MRRASYCILFCLLGLSGLFSTEAHADDPPDSAAQAAQNFAYRRDAMVRRHIQRLVDYDYWHGSFKATTWSKDRGEALERIAMASAVIWVLSHPSDFIDDPDDAYYDLQDKAGHGTSWSKESYKATYLHWIGHRDYPTSEYPLAVGKVNELFKAIYYFTDEDCVASVEVGTKCDYNMVLIELAQLIYAYKDGDTPLTDPRLDWQINPNLAWEHPRQKDWTFADFLTNNMIYRIICQRDSKGGSRRCEDLKVPYAFKALSDELTFKRYAKIGNSALKAITAETENHVLSITAYDYLITNWVMWQGGLDMSDPGSRRQSDSMNQLMWHNAMRWLVHHGVISGRVLNACGRVVHSGMFETNSRPYGRVSVNTLLALANFADPGVSWLPADYDVHPAVVKKGARNAVDYLAAKYAFQSLRGKRQGPMRRRHSDYKKRLNFYQNNGFVTIMSLLSGAYEWDDCTYDSIPDCPMLRWTGGIMLNVLTSIMSCSAGGYRIPDVIHEQMFERGPFYARMKTRYTRKHYPLWRQFPKYFTSNSTVAFHEGENESSLELYFGDSNILLSAGGTFGRYYWISPSYDFWSKPTMLIPRGDFGHPLGESNAWRDGKAALWDAVDEVALSPGKAWDWWESECNIWLYRNFVYSYVFHDKHGVGGGDWSTAPPSFSDKYPFRVPSFWRDFSADSFVDFSIGVADFEIYEFSTPGRLRPQSSAGHGPYPTGDGYFIVRAKFRKDAAKKRKFRKHREFARGFLEIVPKGHYPSDFDAKALREEIEYWNWPSQFPGDHRKTAWEYVLTESKERVFMSSVMGANGVGGEGCDDGILKIWEFDKWLGT